ncbi:MAG TPA: MarR family transcriptional regulator [Thermoanaerobaculia bacterium]|nr:MarR family transcriptional regulator [Thermoanaerobaculia bacterium]
MGDVLKKRIQQESFESPLQEALLNLLVAADHLKGRMERACAEFGITGGQYNVLRILRGAHPLGHPRCEIARRMIERSPDVTRLVDRLEKQGLVERNRSAEDRRLSFTRITPRGLALLESMEPRVAAQERDLAARLSVPDLQELSRICEKVYDEEV